MARATRLHRNVRSSLFGNNLVRLRRIEALEQRALLAANVYVNDNWVESVNHAGGTAGVVEVNDVVDNSADPGQPPQSGIFGSDAFATIQSGIAGVDPLGTVHVLMGAYVENVIVDKTLHLLGVGQSVVTVRPAVSGPGVGEIGSLPAGASSIVLVQANDVEISGITLDGDNPSLASGAVVGGADIDARNGIITNHKLLSSIMGLNVHDVAVQNVFLRGIQAGPGSGTFTFTGNRVTNVQGDFDSIGIANFSGSGTIAGNTIHGGESGIVTDGSRGTTITANAVTGARVGIGSYNHGTLGQSNPDVIGGPAALSGNTIDDGVFGSYGIVVINSNSDASVQGNSVTDTSFGIGVLGGGGSVTLTGNTALRTSNEINSIGILVTNEDLDEIGNADATLSGNNVSGFDAGVVLEQLVGGDTIVSITSGSFAGGRTGIVLNGDLALIGFTLGSLVFSGQSGNYITLANGALDDLKIDAAAVTFDGLTGAAMTPAERATLETRIIHEPDDASLGLVVVPAPNSSPVAADQTLTAVEDTKIEGKVTATDADGDKLTFTKVSDPATGTLVLNSDGAFTYTPAANFNGSVDFTFQADDGKGGTDTGKVTLTLTPVNDPPDATNDLAVVIEGSKDNIINVLANDVDPEAGKLTVTKVTQGTGGTVAIGTDNANVIYTPNPGFAGNDIFTYTITDDEGGTDTATVLVTVIGPDSGIAGTDGDDVFYVKRDATGTKVEVFANDTGTGAPIFSALIDTAVQLTFDTLGGNDRLIVDWVNGDPVPLSGVLFLAGDGNDSLAIEGGNAASVNGLIAYESGKGTNTLDVQSGAARIDSTVAAGGSLDTTVAAGAELITNRLRQNGLVLSDGASVLIRSNGTDAATSVLTSLTMGPGAKLDITNNALVVDYTGDSPASTIRDMILSGRGGAGLGKPWNGAGITSSTVAEVNSADPESRSVGLAENASLPLGAYTTFRGVAVDSTAVLVSYTRTGDANLDGVVNDDDVTIVGASYAPGAPNPSWALGDFDYNGFVDDDDVTLLGAFYNPLAAALTPAPVGTLERRSSLAKVKMDAELIDLIAWSIAIDGDWLALTSGRRLSVLSAR